MMGRRGESATEDIEIPPMSGDENRSAAIAGKEKPNQDIVITKTRDARVTSARRVSRVPPDGSGTMDSPRFLFSSGLQLCADLAALVLSTVHVHVQVAGLEARELRIRQLRARGHG